MKSEDKRGPGRHFISACTALTTVLLASVSVSSCTSTTGSLEMGNPSFAGSGSGMVAVMEDAADAGEAGETVAVAAPDGDASGAASTERADAAPGEDATVAQGDAELPAEVATVPTGRGSGQGQPAQAVAAAPEAEAVARQAAAQPAEQTAQAAATPEPAVPAAEAPKAETKPAEQQPAPTQFASAAPTTNDVGQAEKKRGFLSSFFGTSKAQAAEPPSIVKSKPLVVENVPQKPAVKSKPLVELASVRPAESRASMGGGDALPGVRASALFEIKRKSGLDDDSDIDLHEDYGDDNVVVASAAGLARLAPNGLRVQRESVDVACLKPSLVRMLKTVERHFGQPVVVTSGYRSPSHNKRVRGARNSMHMYCAAADVQVAGVSKWELAKFVRTMPGRGGVGTYCHTNSIHIDVGPERDWNWRCKRRRA